MKVMTTKDARRLLFEGAMALSQVQSNGMCIDMAWCVNRQKQIEKEQAQIVFDIEKRPEVKRWVRRNPHKVFNIRSDEALADIFFGDLNLEVIKRTAKDEKPSVDASVLEMLALKHDLPNQILRYRKLHKMSNTYINNIVKEVNDDGLLHPFFNLHTAVTYRSSSSKINFQNIPIREESQQEIRLAFKPRKGRHLLEVDFKGAEVCVAAAYHKDPVMIQYLTDPTKDMHRDVTQDLFFLSEAEWNKPLRQCGKNKFTFPAFYGSYGKQMAPDLWNYCLMHKLHIGKKADGPHVFDHLKTKGIINLNEFIEHVNDVEYDFWNKRFKVYAKWKEAWYKKYQKRGYFNTLTGFHIEGIMSRNDVINYPVQGSAFHCLLWCLIQLQNWLVANKMKTLIVGQIHDSMVIDLYPKEKDAVLHKVVCLVQKDLSKHYTWINVPMTVEAEMTDKDEPWLRKKEIDLSSYLV